jgi:hypothetical protein
LRHRDFILFPRKAKPERTAPDATDWLVWFPGTCAHARFQQSGVLKKSPGDGRSSACELEKPLV